MFHIGRRLSVSPLLILVLFAIACCASPAHAQREARNRSANASVAAPAAKAEAGDEPPFHEYKGVRLGMTADESRKKLGSPQNKGDDQDLYSFSDDKETVTVYYEGGRVTAIALMYVGAGEIAPTSKAVFGETVAPEADGSVRRMERYTKVGYWLSYTRSAGDAPMTIITLKKID